MADELLKPDHVEKEYDIPKATLRNWRWRGEGPDYIKVTPGRSGRVLYRRKAIEAWLDERTIKAKEVAQ